MLSLNDRGVAALIVNRDNYSSQNSGGSDVLSICKRIPFKAADYLIHNAQVSVTKCDATFSEEIKFNKKCFPVTVLQPH